MLSVLIQILAYLDLPMCTSCGVYRHGKDEPKPDQTHMELGTIIIDGNRFNFISMGQEGTGEVRMSMVQARKQGNVSFVMQRAGALAQGAAAALFSS